jgi:hypothetical protein
MADILQLSWMAKLACVVLLLQIALLPSSATARLRNRAAPAPVVRVATINLTHTTQIYTTGCSPGTVNVTVGTPRTTPVPFYLFTSSFTSSAHAREHHDASKQLPAVYVLNGFNVPAEYYSDLATRLAASGFLVATSDHRRDTAFTQPGIDASCKPYVLTSSATINTLMDAQVAPSSATGGAWDRGWEHLASAWRERCMIVPGHAWGDLAVVSRGISRQQGSAAAVLWGPTYVGVVSPSFLYILRNCSQPPSTYHYKAVTILKFGPNVRSLPSPPHIPMPHTTAGLSAAHIWGPHQRKRLKTPCNVPSPVETRGVAECIYPPLALVPRVGRW